MNAAFSLLGYDATVDICVFFIKRDALEIPCQVTVGEGRVIATAILPQEPLGNEPRFHPLVIGRKGAAFGTIAALMGCYYGMGSGRGAQGVGRATKSAVVTASVRSDTPSLP